MKACLKRKERKTDRHTKALGLLDWTQTQGRRIQCAPGHKRAFHDATLMMVSPRGVPVSQALRTQLFTAVTGPFTANSPIHHRVST